MCRAFVLHLELQTRQKRCPPSHQICCIPLPAERRKKCHLLHPTRVRHPPLAPRHPFLFSTSFSRTSNLVSRISHSRTRYSPSHSEIRRPPTLKCGASLSHSSSPSIRFPSLLSIPAPRNSPQILLPGTPWRRRSSPLARAKRNAIIGRGGGELRVLLRLA